MEFIDILGLVAGFCTSSSTIPQLVKTIKTKKTQDISIFMFVVLLTGNALWIYYGIAKSEVAIITTNIISTLLDIAMLVCHFKYKDNK